MLVLSRFAGESIIIDGDITVTVLEVFRDRVRIGITAPKSVPVHRDEVHARLHPENPKQEPATSEPS